MNWYYCASILLQEQWEQKHFLIYLWKFKINIWFYYSGSETIWSEVLILIMMNVTNQSKSTSFNPINSLSTVNSWTFNLFDFYVFSLIYLENTQKKGKKSNFMLSLLLLFNVSRLWFCTLYSFNIGKDFRQTAQQTFYALCWLYAKPRPFPILHIILYGTNV